MNKTQTVLLIQFNDKERIFNSKGEIRSALTQNKATLMEVARTEHTLDGGTPSLQKSVQAAESLIDGWVV